MSRRAQGYATISDPDAARTIEMDTYTCHHCNSVHHLHNHLGQRLDPGGFCMACMKQICGPCADTGHCDPYSKKMDRVEGKRR